MYVCMYVCTYSYANKHNKTVFKYNKVKKEKLKCSKSMCSENKY